MPSSSVMQTSSGFIGRAGTVRIKIDADWLPQFRNALGQFTAKIRDFTPLWPEVAEQFWDDVQKNIDRQGSFVGGWRALSPAYAAWKRSHVGHTKIMVLTGALQRSLDMGGPGNITDISRGELRLGSRDPKLPYHQRGTRRMPRRPVLFWPGGSVYGRLLQSYSAYRAIEARLPNVRPKPIGRFRR